MLNRYIRVVVLFLSFVLALNVNHLYAQKRRPFVLVIDAGHGGHNKGTRYKSYIEKNITLNLSNKVGNLIKKKHPEVRVLYTRSKDTFIDLDRRPAFAGRNRADFFLSIHVNYTTKKSVNGTESFIIPKNKSHINFVYLHKYGRGSKRIQRENRKLSQEFASLIEKEQRRLGRHSRGVREGNYQVLRECSVPAVLTEIGFISNAKDRRFIITRSGQNKVAKALANAFSSYYKRHHKYRNVKTTSSKSSSKLVVNPKSVRYRVQFMAIERWINKNDKKLRKLGSPINRYQGEANGLYCYTVGNYRTLKSAKALRDRIRRKYREYNDCFIIVVDKHGDRIDAIY